MLERRVLLQVVLGSLAYAGIARADAGRSIEHDRICDRISYLVNESPSGSLPYVPGNWLEKLPDAWHDSPDFAWHDDPIAFEQRPSNYRVAPLHIFGRDLNVVEWVSDGTCRSTAISLWSETYDKRFSRWGSLQPDEVVGLGESLFVIDETPYVALRDTLTNRFTVFRVDAEGGATPVCDARRLAIVHESPPPSDSNPICSSLTSHEANSPRIETLAHAIPLDDHSSSGIDSYHTTVDARLTTDLDNDGVEERVGLARWFIDTASCGYRNEVTLPLLLDETGEHIADTRANWSLREATMEFGPVGVQATLRIVDFRGARYMEQRSLPASSVTLHKVLRLDGNTVSQVCDFKARPQYEVVPIKDGERLIEKPDLVNISSSDPELCTAFTSLIRSNVNLEAGELIEPHCGKRLRPIWGGEFSEPDWHFVGLAEWSIGFAEQIWRAEYESELRNPAFDWQAVWSDNIGAAALSAKFARGSIRIEHATVDLDSNGDPDDVWRLDAFGCHENTVSYPRLMVKRSDAFEPIRSVPNLNSGTDVVIWREHPFAIELYGPSSNTNSTNKPRTEKGFVAELREVRGSRDRTHSSLGLSAPRCVVRSNKDLAP